MLQGTVHGRTAWRREPARWAPSLGRVAERQPTAEKCFFRWNTGEGEIKPRLCHEAFNP
jgi:hypothetical protein